MATCKQWQLAGRTSERLCYCCDRAQNNVLLAITLYLSNRVQSKLTTIDHPIAVESRVDPNKIMYVNALSNGLTCQWRLYSQYSRNRLSSLEIRRLVLVKIIVL